jgi:glycerol-3-phosphate O-acyltransferase
MIWALKEDKISPDYNVSQVLIKNGGLCMKYSKATQHKANFV